MTSFEWTILSNDVSPSTPILQKTPNYPLVSFLRYDNPMISHLSGKVLSVEPTSTIVDVGGVGYEVFATGLTLSSLKVESNISLWTHLAVRETALDLYGFITKQDLVFFELLITISGIGPKTALGILNVATIETIRNAVFSENTANLIKISGISKKVAEKIVLELRGKLDGTLSETEAEYQDDSDTLEALTSLGYSQKDVREALKQVPKDVVGTSERVKYALKQLGS